MEAKGRSLGSSILVPSVQELAKKPLVKVPPQYVQIDPDPLVASFDKSWDELFVVGEDERRNTRIFQVANGGKKEILARRRRDLEGFGQAFVVSEEQKLDWADMFYMVTLPRDIRKPHLFPKLPLPFRDTLEAYSREVNNISLKTLIFIAKASNMEVEDMKVMFDEGLQSMRMNYYPPCPEPEKVIGLSPHSDPLGITFLLQINEVEGLQIRKDGIWIPVKPLPNAFIVNIGDIIEIMTNGLYKSIEHRATVNSEKERLSVATFVAPRLDANFGPAPSLIAPKTGTPPKFIKVSFVDYFKNFFSRELKSKSNIEHYYI